MSDSPVKNHSERNGKMTIKKIIEKIEKILNKPVQGIYAEWENEISYEAYGEASFPVRVTQRQAEEVAEYLSDHGSSYWLSPASIKINPKETYILWIRSYIYKNQENNFSVRHNYLWGIRRVTESPDRR
jgi:hypothetical protein